MSDWFTYGVPLIALAGALAGNLILFAFSRAFDRRWPPPRAGN